MSDRTVSPAAQDTPYAGLNPDCVLDALASVGLQGDGRLIQLNSYENRVYQVFLEGGKLVIVKFYRPGRWSDAQIAEEHRFVEQLGAAELPVAPSFRLEPSSIALSAKSVVLICPTLAQFRSNLGSYRFSVSERLSGRAPELGNLETLMRVGRMIGRIHAIGRSERFSHRQVLDPQTYGIASRDWLLAQDLVPLGELAPWREISAAALAAVDLAFKREASMRELRLHGDCHLGNILWADEGPQLVDFDDTCMGPAIQDLWMLLSGDRAAMTSQADAVLEGYEAFMDFDRRELRLIEALRTLRMLHHSAWIARRWSDPAFPLAFPWFAEAAYWAEQTVRLREQVKLMAEPPLSPY